MVPLPPPPPAHLHLKIVCHIGFSPPLYLSESPTTAITYTHQSKTTFLHKAYDWHECKLTKYYKTQLTNVMFA